MDIVMGFNIAQALGQVEDRQLPIFHHMVKIREQMEIRCIKIWASKCLETLMQ